MFSRVLPLGKKEVVVPGDGNCFYRTIAMWSDGKSDRNHGEIKRLCRRVSLSNDVHTCFNLFCSMQTQAGSMSRRASLQVPGQELLTFLAVQLYCSVQFLPFPWSDNSG